MAVAIMFFLAVCLWDLMFGGEKRRRRKRQDDLVKLLLEEHGKPDLQSELEKLQRKKIKRSITGKPIN